MLAVAVICDCLVLGLWLRGSNSVVKLLGGRVQFEWCCQVGWRHGAAVAVFKSDCEVLGLWMRSLNSVVKLLGGRVHSNWCRLVGWWHGVCSCSNL